MGINKGKHRSIAATDLRRHAEEQLKAKAPDKGYSGEDEATQRVHYELQVHQIELEMQNAELRHSRDELERSLGKFTDLYDFAPVGFFTFDRTGIISEVNLSGASLLVVERARLIGKSFGQFVMEDGRPVFAAFLEKVFRSQRKESCELALVRDGDSPLYVQIEAAAVPSGQVCLVAIIDISLRRQLQEKLEILHTNLAARSAELEAANIELEAFNYSVSHDLRSPLTAINSYCQVIQELSGNRLDDVCNGYIREIYEGTLRLNELIETLLDFSRVKHVEICNETVDLSAMARTVAAELSLAEPLRRVKFLIMAGITVDGDAGLWRIVLNNLMGNAWKYTVDEAEPIIEFGKTELDGKPACFVHDNGPGFDMSFADRLFIPFQRIPGTSVVGNGIGLATVERIVKRHGGRVWAESEPGKGATFIFTLE